MNKWIDYTMPFVIAISSGVLGYGLSTLQHQREHEDAVSRCYSTKSVDAYVSKLGTDEFVCFKEDVNRKRISKSLIVMPD